MGIQNWQCACIIFFEISYAYKIQVEKIIFFSHFLNFLVRSNRDQRERQIPLPVKQHSWGNVQKESDVLILSGNSGLIILALAVSHTDEIFLESNYVHCITLY